MHIHRCGELERSADEVACGRRGKDEPFRGDALTRPEDAADGACPRFDDGSERLLHDIRETSTLVAGSRVGASIDGTALQIPVIPLHLADEALCDFGSGSASDEQVDRIANLSDLGEHYGGPGSNQQICRISDGWVCCNARKGIAASALQTHDKIRGRTSDRGDAG